MRTAYLTGLLTVLLGTQLIALDPPTPMAPTTSGPSLPEWASASSSGATPWVSAPTYRGKRWWGLCPAYAADSVSALYREYQASPRLQRALEGFDWGRARLVTLDAPQAVHVAYAHQDGSVAWSSKAIVLPAGEVMITDRRDPLDESSGHLVRTYCCNTTSSIVRPPVRRDEPPTEELEPWWPLTPPPADVPVFVPPGDAVPGHTTHIPPVIVTPPPGVVVPPSIIAFPPIMTLPPTVVVYVPPGDGHGHGKPPPHIQPPHGGDEPYVPPGMRPEPPGEEKPIPEPSMILLFGVGILYIGRKIYDHFA